MHILICVCVCAFIDVCYDILLKVFEENSVFAHEEKLYQPFLSLLKVSKKSHL